VATAQKDQNRSLADALAAALGLMPGVPRDLFAGGGLRASDQQLRMGGGPQDDPDLDVPAWMDIEPTPAWMDTVPPEPTRESFLPPTTTLPPIEPVWTPPVPPPVEVPPVIDLPVPTGILGGILGPVIGMIGGILFPGNMGPPGTGEIYDRKGSPTKRSDGAGRADRSNPIVDAASALFNIWRGSTSTRVPGRTPARLPGKASGPDIGSASPAGWPGTGAPGRPGPSPSGGTARQTGIATVAQTAEEIMMQQAGLGRPGVGKSDTPKRKVLTVVEDVLLESITNPKRPAKAKTEECDCEKPKERKPRKPRLVCYEGTFRQKTFGQSKSKTGVIPCRL
jgi:hypothetical protein